METKTLKNRIVTGFTAVADVLPITATSTYNEVKMKNAPCYKCENRTPECHGKCEAYAEYVDTHPRRDRSEQLWYAYKFEKDKKIKRRMDNR